MPSPLSVNAQEIGTNSETNNLTELSTAQTSTTSEGSSSSAPLPPALAQSPQQSPPPQQLNSPEFSSSQLEFQVSPPEYTNIMPSQRAQNESPFAHQDGRTSPERMSQGQQRQQQQQQRFLPPISLVSTCEEMNPSRRSSFEDCSIYAPAGTWNAPDENMAFLAVVDGHGGRDIVEFLEDALLYHVTQELQFDRNDKSNVSVAERLERAFLMVDIHSKAMELTNSGATVAMCLVTRGNKIYEENNATSYIDLENTWTIYAANVGDARLVMGNGGKAHRMTQDHRTDDPSEVRRIEESGGFVFKGRVLGILAVTRSLGDHCMKEYVIAQPYTSDETVTVASEEDTPFLILACDGLWDVFQDQEAIDFVLDRIEEKELVAKYLVEEALKRGSTDNVTVSVAFLT